MFDESYDSLMQLQKLRQETQQIEINDEYSETEGDSVISEVSDDDQSVADSNVPIDNLSAQKNSDREIIVDIQKATDNFKKDQPIIDEAIIVSQKYSRKNSKDSNNILINQEIVTEPVN